MEEDFVGRRTGWEFEVRSEVVSICYRVKLNLAERLREITSNNGEIVSGINDKIKELEQYIETEIQKAEDMKNTYRQLDDKLKFLKSEYNRGIEESKKYEIKAQKYEIEKLELEDLQEGTKEYEEKKKRVDSFEESARKYDEITRKLDDLDVLINSVQTQRDSLNEEMKKLERRDGHDAYLHYIKQSLVPQLNHLKEDKEKLEGVVLELGGVEENLLSQFDDQQFQNDAIDAVMITINKTSNQVFSDRSLFSEADQLDIIDYIFSIIPDEDWKKFNPFAFLAKNSGKIVDVEGKKVFNLKDIQPNDLKNNFLAYLKKLVQNATIRALFRYEHKSNLFVPEEQAGSSEDGESYSLYDINPGGNSEDQTWGDTKHLHEKSYTRSDEKLSDAWRGLKKYLDEELDDMAQVTVKAIQKQFPGARYFARVNSSEISTKVKEAYSGIIQSLSVYLSSGNIVHERLKSVISRYFRKMLAGTDFDSAYVIIYAVLAENIYSYVYDSIVRRIEEDGRDEDEYTPQEENVLMRLDEKISEAHQAIKDHTKMKLARRIHRIARRIVREM